MGSFKADKFGEFTIDKALIGKKIPLKGGPGDGLTITYMGSRVVFDPLGRMAPYACVKHGRRWVYVPSLPD